MRYEGKTEADAIAAASEAIGVPASELKYKVVRDERSFWGGRVVEIELEQPGRVERREPGVERPEEQEPGPGSGLELSRLPAAERPPQSKAPAPEGAMDEEAFAAVEAILSELLSAAGFFVEIRRRPAKEMLFELIGDDVEPLLASGGEGLSGLEVLTGRIASKQLARPVYPRLDAEGFRAHQRESLEELALRSAEEAKRTHRPQLLPPLSPAERRLIHLALAEDPDVETESEGDGFLKTSRGAAQGQLRSRVDLRSGLIAAVIARARITRLGPRSPDSSVMRPRTESVLDTIAALATPVGRSALALLRVSGPESGRILRTVTRGLPEEIAPRHSYLVSFVDGGGDAIDRGVATYFAGPASSTGEDAAELSIHGSPVVVERMLAALIAAGARTARPGEFTERAFLLGKMDLVEAEAVRDLIEARTEAAARLSARRMEGRLSRLLEEVREELVAAAAGLAATIDFSEDVGEAVSPETLSRIESAGETLRRLAASYATGRLLSAGCRVAIVGRPNAGKSTLFNALVGSARAIVTDVPGTTRDTLHATADVRGIPVELVDTAGLRETADTVEKIGVGRAWEAAGASDMLLYVFDAAVGWTPEDAAALAKLDGGRALVIANKIDKLSGRSPGGAPSGATPLSGIAPDAGEKLHALLEERLAREVSTDVASEILASVRQRDLVERARAASARTLTALSHGDSPEYASTHLDDAIDALADLAGETTAEDVLRQIFSTFCIGK